MGRRAHGNDDQVGVLHAFLHGRGETQTAFRHVFMEEFFKTIFVKSDFASLQGFDF